MAKKTSTTPKLFVSNNQITVKEATIGMLSIGKNDAGYVPFCDVCNTELGTQDLPVNAVEALAVHTAVEHASLFSEWAKKFDLPEAQIQALIPSTPVQVVKAPRVRKPKAVKAEEPTQAPTSPLQGEDAEVQMLQTLLGKLDTIVSSLSKSEIAKADDAKVVWENHEAMLNSNAFDLFLAYSKAQNVIEEYGMAIEAAMAAQKKYARVPSLVTAYQRAVDTTSESLAVLIGWTVDVSNTVPGLLDRGMKVSVAEKARRDQEAAIEAQKLLDAQLDARMNIERQAAAWTDGQDKLFTDLLSGRQRVWNGMNRGWMLDLIGKNAINELNAQKAAHKDEEGFNPAAFAVAYRRPIIHQMVEAQLKAFGFEAEKEIGGTKHQWDWENNVRNLTGLVLEYNELAAKKATPRENGKGKNYPTYEAVSVSPEAKAKGLPVCEKEMNDVPLGKPTFRADAVRREPSTVTSRIVIDRKANGNENIPVGGAPAMRIRKD